MSCSASALRDSLAFSPPPEDMTKDTSGNETEKTIYTAFMNIYTPLAEGVGLSPSKYQTFESLFVVPDPKRKVIYDGGLSLVERGTFENRPVAIKTSKTANGADAIYGDAAFSAIVTQLGNRGLPAFVGISVNDKSEPSLVLDWIDGFTLLKHPITAMQPAQQLLRDLGTHVQGLHKFQIAHGDIKPENVMYNSAGNGFLVDMGCAKVFKAFRTAGNPVLKPYIARMDAAGDVQGLQFIEMCLAQAMGR
ncbi:hypothetical protein BDZ88DRAFT_434487 [Geranomyces variabilis]|nr:hypothetical protein BDZ88DRAFT_434487 [Geranomyces variabilis]